MEESARVKNGRKAALDQKAAAASRGGRDGVYAKVVGKISKLR